MNSTTPMTEIELETYLNKSYTLKEFIALPPDVQCYIAVKTVPKPITYVPCPVEK